MNELKLLCLGDSLTEGYDIDPSLCWVSLLKEREGWEITNAGISGDMSAGLLARLPLELYKKTYTHVFLMGGTNDVEFGLSPNHIISNLKGVMRQLRYLDIHYTIGIPLPFDDQDTDLTRFQYVTDKGTYREKLNVFCDELRVFLVEDEADFIDFREYFTDPDGTVQSDLFRPDGLHQSAKGHELMYRIVKEHYINLK